MLLIGLIFGALAGFLLAAAYGVTLDGHDHATDHDHNTTETTALHSHEEMLKLANDGNAPTIAVDLHADPAGGWNIELRTTNFRFSPEHVSQDHQDGEGHAHAYLNGQKIARLYGHWMQLPTVKSGDVVAVGLYSNDHKVLSVGQKAIFAAVTIP
jgi:hypothetical protein